MTEFKTVREALLKGTLMDAKQVVELALADTTGEAFDAVTSEDLRVTDFVLNMFWGFLASEYDLTSNEDVTRYIIIQTIQSVDFEGLNTDLIRLICVAKVESIAVSLNMTALSPQEVEELIEEELSFILND